MPPRKTPNLNPTTTLRPLDELRPHPENPRRGNVDAIAASLVRNGQYAPIVALPDGTVLAGSHRLAAAKSLGWVEMLVTTVTADKNTARRIVLADNRTSDLATYDQQSLANLLSSVGDVDGTGFTTTDVDDLLRSLAPPEPEPIVEEPLDPARKIQKRAKAGDLWQLGNHRILCGDCRNPDDVERLLDGAVVNLAFTSPPYADRRKYDESSGFKPIPPNEYVEWFAPIAANVATHLAEDGSWFINIKPSTTPDNMNTELYVHDLVVAHVREWGWNFATEYCWQRNGVPKQPSMRFKNQFEPIYQFTLSRWKFRPDAVRHHSENAVTYDPDNDYIAERRQGDGTPLANRKGTGRGNTSWHDSQGNGAVLADDLTVGPGLAYPGNRLPTFAGSHEATGHTVAFPVGLPQSFTNAYTDEHDNIFDPFMGSGSTLLAANNTNRTAYGTELSPEYVDIILDRYERHTDTKPSRQR